MPRKRKGKSRPASARSMVEIRFPSDNRYLHMVHQLTTRLAASTGFEAVEAEKIAVAVDEATANVIQHAYKGQKGREIEIHFDPEGDSLEIEILHDGEGLEDVPLPQLDLGKLVAKRRKGGLGLYIMRQMMDDLRFEKSASGKSKCVMVRYKQRQPRNA